MAQQVDAERQFQNTIVDTLGLFGYEGVHVFPLMDRYGTWRTPTTSPGWPDLVFLRDPRILAIEVKKDGVTVPPHQRAWLTLFGSIPCARAWVARPSDPPFDDLVAWIKRPADAPHRYGFEPVEDPVAVLAQHRRKKKARSARPRRRT